MKVGLVLPTLNAAPYIGALLQSVRNQTFQPDDFIVIDSSSSDDTIKSLSADDSVRSVSIGREEFNHGGTRNLGVSLLDGCDIVVFITQDCLFADSEALRRLCDVFHDDGVMAAYGRQLPRQGAGLIEAHARYFNYPDAGVTRSKEDIPRFGFKAAFISNSFAAYRVAALREIGGFPSDVILGEDFYAAARLLQAGGKIAYVADSRVLHSHGYGVIQEARRYFDIGVFHASNPWLFQLLGRAGGEGLKFVRSELGFLLRKNVFLIPEALIRTVMKLLFYRLGLAYRLLPRDVNRSLSMHRFYWD